MPVIAVVNTKGGVGKSTVATNLASLFARDHAKVKLIDSDADQHSSDDWLETRGEDAALKDIARQIVRGRTYQTLVAESRLWKWLVVDCPGADSSETRGAMGAADLIVMPVGMGQFEINVVDKMAKLIKVVRDSGNETPVLAVLNNADVKCTREAAEALDYLCTHADLFKVHDDVLWTRQAVRMALREGRGVHELKDRDDKAVAEFESLYKGVLNGLA